MKNINIIKVINILSPLMLSLELSSARRRFVRHLKGFQEDYNLEADAIRQEFSEKNADGSMKVFNQVISFTVANRKLADAKFEILNNLEIMIDWTGEEKDRDLMIIILNDKIVELKKATEYSDTIFSFIEEIEKCVNELLVVKKVE